ncbi:MAG TPA: universal stress protein [Tissierellales bacterium]|jgi:nucleotide-binding universal stress UspA family protein|uniref:universal stress protein n=1 Tax=Gudongella oleilytica TaxID=1582259 RepID=UPI000EE1D09C|nr:universal stress protein [Gudongella oleilytica]MDY0257448.1 universal stress protein [Gudongella oleilytica]HCO18443.1 universal stress protein [Tissierellales bacterium]
MDRILVPVDGSENSMKAVEKAVEIGSLKKSHITILTVVNSKRDNPYILEQDYSTDISQKNIENGKRVLNNALELCAGYAGEIDTLLRNGDIAEVVIDTAEELDIDLIVMGRRGMSISARSLLGSISNKVLNYANRSVLVVK